MKGRTTAGVVLVILALWLASRGCDNPPPEPDPVPKPTGSEESAMALLPLTVPDSPVAGTGESALLSDGADPLSTPAPYGLVHPDFASLDPGKEARERPVWLTGILTAADGELLAGVDVRLEPRLTWEVVEKKAPHTDRMRTMLEIRGGPEAGVLDFTGPALVALGRAVARTDSSGRFAVTAPAVAGSYRLVFGRGKRTDSSVFHRSEEIEFTAGAREDLGLIRLRARGAVGGVTVDEQGKMVGRVRVYWWPIDYGVPTQSLPSPGQDFGRRSYRGFDGMLMGGGGLGRTTSDEEGRFELADLPPGPVVLWGRLPFGIAREYVRVTVPEGRTAGPVNVLSLMKESEVPWRK